MSLWDDEAGYDRTDPKHPDWASAQLDRADDDRKRRQLGEVVDDRLPPGPLNREENR